MESLQQILCGWSNQVEWWLMRRTVYMFLWTSQWACLRFCDGGQKQRFRIERWVRWLEIVDDEWLRYRLIKPARTIRTTQPTHVSVVECFSTLWKAIVLEILLSRALYSCKVEQMWKLRPKWESNSQVSLDLRGQTSCRLTLACGDMLHLSSMLLLPRLIDLSKGNEHYFH